MANGKKLTFFKFGKLEVLVNGQVVDTIEISRGIAEGEKLYRFRESESIDYRIYAGGLGEIKKMLSRKAKRDYAPKGVFGSLKESPDIRIRDLTNGREGQY